MLKAIQEAPCESEKDNSSRDALVLNASTSSLPLQRRKTAAKRPPTRDFPENIKNHQLDSISDDELPDGLIVYDIPSIESLQNLETRRKSPIKRKQQLKKSHQSQLPSSSNSSLSSPATRASSIFSLGSTFSDMDPLDSARVSDDYHNQLSKEARLLFSNKNYVLEESLQRISLLKSISRQSLDSVSSFASDSSTTILLKSKTQTFITSTRQPNLPPKDYLDIKKHENQYQMILNSQIHLEQQKMKEYTKTTQRKNIQLSHDTTLWEKVVNNYPILIKLPQTRELWWRSMPNSVRPTICKRQLMRKSPEEDDARFEIIFKEMNEKIDSACNYKSIGDELSKIKFQKENPDILETVENIEKISNLIQLSYPDLGEFQYGETFDSILKISLVFNKIKLEFESIKTVPLDKIINIICVLFYVFKSELVTLTSLITLLHRKLVCSLLTTTDIPELLTEQLAYKSNEYLSDTQEQVDKFLLNMTPRLYNHFVQQDVNTLRIIQSTVSTLFTKQLNLDVTLRVFDIYLFEGDSFLLRCLLALINKLSWKLYGSREEIYQLLGDSCLLKLNDLDYSTTESESIISKSGTITSISSSTSRSQSQSQLQSHCTSQSHSQFVYLDVGDDDAFINDVRSVLKKK